MSMRIMQAGIEAIQSGNKAEGARLLRIAIKDGELTPQLVAVAYLWLAETRDDAQHKLTCYNSAIMADPTNGDAQQRLAGLLAAQLPPTPSPQPVTAPPLPQPVQPAPSAPPPYMPMTGSSGAQAVVGIFGGPNGPGTAVFVSREGVLATTRYVVGGMERVTVELGGGYQTSGEVVRCFPDYDVALVRVNQNTASLPPITPYMRIPDEMPLIAQSYVGTQLKGRQRPSKRVIAPHWISTDFRSLSDAGGNPLFDERNYLVGIMTKNSSRASGYLYGVHINAVQRCYEQYLNEMQSGERRSYCPHCGSASRALAAGYFHCEICGGIAPQAQQFARYPQENPFIESSRIRCNRCDAQVGFARDGRCLRCGQLPGTSAKNRKG